MKIHPYLNFDGQAKEVITFYKSILGGDFDEDSATSAKSQAWTISLTKRKIVSCT